jgi:aquaporin Z
MHPHQGTQKPGYFSTRGWPVDFMDAQFEWRRLFAEMLGTFFLVFVAVGGGMVNARFGGKVIPLTAQVSAPGLMVGSIILFMGTVSGAHLNPGVSVAFALRHDFPWRRVPGYIGAQLAGAVLATLFLVALLGRQGAAGLTLPGPGISEATALAWEIVLSVGLISTILGYILGGPEHRADERHRRRHLHRARPPDGRAG